MRSVESKNDAAIQCKHQKCKIIPRLINLVNYQVSTMILQSSIHILTTAELQYCYSSSTISNTEKLHSYAVYVQNIANTEDCANYRIKK